MLTDSDNLSVKIKTHEEEKRIEIIEKFRAFQVHAFSAIEFFLFTKFFWGNF